MEAESIEYNETDLRRRKHTAKTTLDTSEDSSFEIVGEVEEASPKELSPELDKYEEKRKEIENYLLNSTKTDPDYVNKLRHFALSDGGLIDDTIRAKVWPDLLELEPDKYEPAPSEEEYKSHHEYHQVVLDVNRSLKRFPPGIPYEQRVAMQDQLIRLILRVIMKYPSLQYYQGYHDVVITFLLVVEENVAFHIMEKLSVDHFKHFMEPTMEKTSQLLDYIYPLLDNIHPQLCEYIERAGVGTMFCLPWFLTWYSHTLTKYEHVVRFYDYFLASPPLVPLYLIPIIVVHRQDQIFQTECDMANLHIVLSQLPEDLPYDMLLAKASQLHKDHPPGTIERASKERAWRKKQKEEEEIEEARRRINRMRNPRNNMQMANRRAPNGLPYGTLRVFLVGASFAVGLYAYMRLFNAYDFMPSDSSNSSELMEY